jgi:limonene-1,2-epoxide hydrolase
MREPIELVESFLKAFEAMDFDTALTHLADDCEYTNIPLMSVKGHEGVRQVLGPFFEPVKENEFQLLRKAASGNVVFFERLDRHLTEAGWRELPVNSVFEVENGKITVWREYFDAPTAQQIHATTA